MPTTATEERMPVYGPAATEKQIRQRTILPVAFCLRDEARRHVLDGLAVWKNRTNAIQMKKMPAELAIRGASCKVTEPTITANADGVLWAKVIVAGWRGYLHNTLGQPNVVVEYA